MRGLWVLEELMIQCSLLRGHSISLCPKFYFPEYIFDEISMFAAKNYSQYNYNPWLGNKITALQLHTLTHRITVEPHQLDVIILDNIHVPTLFWKILKEKHGNTYY